MFGHIMTLKVKPELDKKSSWRAYPHYKKVKPDRAPCFISIDVHILVQQRNIIHSRHKSSSKPTASIRWSKSGVGIWLTQIGRIRDIYHFNQNAALPWQIDSVFFFPLFFSCCSSFFLSFEK